MAVLIAHARHAHGKDMQEREKTLEQTLDFSYHGAMKTEFALRGRAKEAERALENACLHRFGTLRPAQPMPVLRSDNGLVFQSRNFLLMTVPKKGLYNGQRGLRSRNAARHPGRGMDGKEG
jgi:hypothetical protein